MAPLIDLESLKLKLYDAALGQSSWQDALSGIQTAFGGRGATLLEQGPSGGGAQLHAASGFDQSTLKAYVEHFAPLNVCLRGRDDLWKLGMVRTETMACPSAVLLRSEYYNDYMRPNDMRYLLSTTPVRDHTTSVHFTIFRSHDAPAFDRQAMDALTFLAPHLQRAAQLHRQFDGQATKIDLLEGIVGRLGRAAAIVDQQGRPFYVNDTLAQMVAQADGLLLTSDKLTAADRHGAATLRLLIADACNGGGGGACALSRISKRPPYSVLVSPALGAQSICGPIPGRALVILSDPASQPRSLSSSMLQRLFGLTPAEAQVARRIAGGASVGDVARRSDISVATARTHLKRIFQKTATHRQGELVRLLLSL